MGSPRSIPSGIAAVRGAVPVSENTSDAIVSATARLLTAIVETNRIDVAQVVSAIFTVTADLDADFPAHAARRLGWRDVPLLNAREIPVPGSMPRVVRVLLTVSGVAPGRRLRPVYLDEAAALRPDLAGTVPGNAPRRTALPKGARRLALVGLGQIGGSIGLALASKPLWWRVGFDADASVADQALRAGAIDEVAPSLAAACRGAQLAVLATHVEVLPAVIAATARALPRGAALLDTGSARGVLAAALEHAAARGIRAVGGHPIAGNEGRGFTSARATLFEGAAFALLPSGRLPAIVTHLVRDLGARPVRIEASAHDRALARTSHLPYVLACGLSDVGGAAARRGLSGPGFRDMTRLAASDPRMAESYVRANAREVERAWHALQGRVESRIARLKRRRTPD